MLDDYILNDLDSFDLDSDDSTDDAFEDNVQESSETLDSATFDFIHDDSDSILDDEAITFTDRFIESSSVSEQSFSHSENPYRPISFGHSLGWNGRCRVCSCGGWAGFGDTCACCGHFYKDHI